MTLLSRVAGYCQTHNLLETGDAIVVGVSGGADSVCLLALLKELAPQKGLRLHAAHLNHTLRGQAAGEDAAFVKQLAEAWNVPLTIGEQNVAALAQTQKLSLEEAGRKARYAFLAKTAHNIKANKIAVAHNADDQTETVLMRLLRGAGVTGLRGMLPKSPLANYAAETDRENAPLILIRPLLNTPRSNIETYCQSMNVAPRQDASNRDKTFLRNRIRLELLPTLESYNPNIHQALQKTARLMAADYEVLQSEAGRAWRFVVTASDDDAITFDWQDWLSLPLALQRQTLRRAIHTLRPTLRNIDFVHIEQAIDLLKICRTGAKLDLPQNVKLSVGYHTFTIGDKDHQIPFPNLPRLNSSDTIPLQIPGITRLPNSKWYLHLNLFIRSSISDERLRERTPWRAYLDSAVVGQNPYLRTRLSGDLFYPFGLNGRRQRLKKFMINQKIPAQQRDYVPLLLSEAGQICWVCGHRIDHRSRVTAKTTRILSVEFKQQ